MRLTVTMPLPSDDLRVNAATGKHWGGNRRAKMDYAIEAKPEIDRQRHLWTGLAAVRWPVHLNITVYVGNTMKGNPQLPDTSDVGTWTKYPLDLLVKAGAFPDDNAKRINPVTLWVQWDAKNPRVEFSWDTGGHSE